MIKFLSRYTRKNHRSHDSRSPGLEAPGKGEGDRLNVSDVLPRDIQMATLQLRHQVFCEELGWLPTVGTELEIDEFDVECDSVVAWQGEDVLGMLRLVRGPGPYMIDRYFSHHLESAPDIGRGSDVAEISRLCVRKDVRQNLFPSSNGPMPISLHLYRGTYAWARRNGVRFHYCITTPAVARLLTRQGIPLRAISRSQASEDRCDQVLSILDWREFEGQRRFSDLVEWFKSA